jgi:hypothetical protein
VLTLASEYALQRRTTLFTIPIALIVMSAALVALIYWGGFVEQARNS